MKKSSLLILLIAVNSLLNAQIFIHPYAGYMFSSHPFKMQSVEVVDFVQTVYITKLKYGEGMNPGMSVGYKVNNYLSIELNGCTHVFTTFNNSIEQRDLRTLDNFSYSGFFGDFEYQSKIYQVTPQLGYYITKNKLIVCMKIGPNFLKSKINHNTHYIDWELDIGDWYPLNTNKDYEYSSKFNIGIRSSVGIDYQISSGLSASVNFVSVYNNCNITRGVITRYEIDGVNHLYKIQDATTDYDKGENVVNFSHVGFNIGIKYIFKKISKTTPDADNKSNKSSNR